MGIRPVSIARDERGISSVVGAAVLLAIFGAATLSVDAGNGWQTRRNLITATDAAALAEATELGITGTSTSCAGVYQGALENNAGGDVYERVCSVVPGAGFGTGYVQVEARKPVSVRFGGVLGLSDTNVYSMSAAMVGYPDEGRGLRPIGFCNQNEHVQEWLALRARTPSGYDAEYNALKDDGAVDSLGRIEHPASSAPQGSYAGFGVVHRMYFERSIDDGLCGTFDGNWGWLNFDGGSNETPEINDWLRTGYDGTVSIRDDATQAPCAGTPGAGDADDSGEGCVPASPGSLGNSVSAALDAMLNKPIHILIIDTGECVGGGTTCRLESWGFLGVILRGYQVTGAQGSRYFDFEFTNIQVSGACCDPTPVNSDTGVRAIALCAVDHDPTAIAAATRCGAVT